MAMDLLKLQTFMKNQMPCHNKNTHGGSRPNSGAKQKYGEPTKSVTFRIPESKIKDVKKLVTDYLKSLIEGSKPY